MLSNYPALFHLPKKSFFKKKNNQKIEGAHSFFGITWKISKIYKYTYMTEKLEGTEGHHGVRDSLLWLCQIRDFNPSKQNSISRAKYNIKL